MATAAVLVVGNEILTGKVREANVEFLANELFALGVALLRVVVCSDDVAVIAADVNELRASHDWLITTGGVGPTHDDVTIEAIAKALGRRVVRSAEMEALLRAFYKDRITDGHLRMADVPEGANLVRSTDVPWPTAIVENVCILPGVPELVRIKFPVVRERFRAGAGFVSRAIYTSEEEATIADLMREVAAQHPLVTIGSYIGWRREDYKTKVTFDGVDAVAVDRARDALVARLPREALLRSE